MAKEDAIIIEQFKKVVLQHLEDVAIALPALIPQTKEDEVIFKTGLRAINDIIYNLKQNDSIRELSRYLDVQKILEDFDSESIGNLNAMINNSSRNALMKIEEMIDEDE